MFYKGGGGGAKAGVRNAVLLYKVDPYTLEISEVSEYRFAPSDDGCMSIAVHPTKSCFIAGVNSSEAKIRIGDNRNARFFYIQNKSIHYSEDHSVPTVNSQDPLHYQKVGKFSKDGKVGNLFNIWCL
jgi:hypothetical protein